MDVWCVYMCIWVLPIVNRSGDWKGARAHKGCRAIKKKDIRVFLKMAVTGLKLLWCIESEWDFEAFVTNVRQMAKLVVSLSSVLSVCHSF
jgi:hypothetical protein